MNECQKYCVTNVVYINSKSCKEEQICDKMSVM